MDFWQGGTVLTEPDMPFETISCACFKCSLRLLNTKISNMNQVFTKDNLAAAAAAAAQRALPGFV